ncbi:MAG: chain length determinant family protein [Acidobacteriia bacterium]|nr:chain length determinant family protein [Terriglobia bacterium]
MNSITTAEPESTAPESTNDDVPNPTSPGSRRTSGDIPGEPYEFHVLDLLIILSRRKQVILRTTLAAAVLATIVSLLLPNRYTATANILPPQQSPSLAASMIGQLGALGPMAALAQKDLGLKNPNDLYVGMLRCRTVEDALIRRFDLLRGYRDKRMSDARRDLESASSIVLAKEGFISISVEDKDRSRAPQIANAYVEQLRKLTQDLAVTEAGQRRVFFERQMEVAKNNLADAEQALKQTEQKTGLIQWDGQAKAIIESVVKLRAAIAAKEVELHAMRLFSTEQNPDVRLGEQQLSGMRAQLARMEKESSGPGNVVGSVQVPAGNVPEAGLQYVRRLRDLKYAEAIWELLTKQYEAARLDEAKTAAVIQVLDPAIEPDRKSSPKRTWIIAIVTLLGFFGSMGYVLLAEAFCRLRLNPEVDARWTMLRTCVFPPHFQPHA